MLNSQVAVMIQDRVATGQGKVREIQSQGKVSEKSGNFEISQGSLTFFEKSGKSNRGPGNLAKYG